jgi:hypothetical protein
MYRVILAEKVRSCGRSDAAGIAYSVAISDQHISSKEDIKYFARVIKIDS